VIGAKLRWYRSVGSTNEVAMKLATEEGVPHGTVVLADHQTAGRGRQGRSWVDQPRASLLMSVVLRPQIPAEEAGSLMLMGAVTVTRAIRQVTGLPAEVKWPNDILIDRKKVSGTLLETVTKESQVEVAILGIGVNCNEEQSDFPPGVRNRATSLRLELCREVDRAVLLEGLLLELERQYQSVLSGEAATIADDWRSLSMMLGREVTVEPGFGQPFTATAEDITEQGLLVLRHADGRTESVAAADVSVSPPDEV